MASILHVATGGSDLADGTAASPLRTINHAAQRARPGDTVIVHEGEYREWVKPNHGGLSEQRRITYMAATGEKVVIKGSEQVQDWELVSGTVWRAVVPNTVFGDYNPFAIEVSGDWIVYPNPAAPRKHLGDVYLNGRSFYEAASIAEVSNPAARTEVVDDWTGVTVPVHDVQQRQYRWFAQVDQDSTTIWANFQGADPNTELVEINVRRSVFYPVKHHLNYITVRGFEMAQAATQWAPPTADQPGLVGPNWAKGWIIEDNIIHDAKCSAISIGKEASTGDNYSSARGDKPGYQYQIESVFSARQIGWDREHIGSHIVRRNTIFDCGQTGIVGHLGCVFSTIEDNHIYNIALKREFYGFEIAGIKLHAAIDVEIRHNRIHDCSLGIWLDWQTQGTRVARNLLYRNNRDLFVEVSHGPYVVDHNIFASIASLEVFSQGGAFVNNLVAGAVRLETVLDRATPYHVPHSTQVAGFATICSGDDRYLGNIFLGGDLDSAYAAGSPGHGKASYGTAGYDEFPGSFEEFKAGIHDVAGDHERFAGLKLPVNIRSNVYGSGAYPFAQEQDALVLNADSSFSIAVADEGKEVYLDVDLPPEFSQSRMGVVTSVHLGRARSADADFEDRQGHLVCCDTDLVGQTRSLGEDLPVGPLVALEAGQHRLRIW